MLAALPSPTVAREFPGMWFCLCDEHIWAIFALDPLNRCSSSNHSKPLAQRDGCSVHSTDYRAPSSGIPRSVLTWPAKLSSATPSPFGSSPDCRLIQLVHKRQSTLLPSRVSHKPLFFFGLGHAPIQIAGASRSRSLVADNRSINSTRGSDNTHGTYASRPLCKPGRDPRAAIL